MAKLRHSLVPSADRVDRASMEELEGFRVETVLLVRPKYAPWSLVDLLQVSRCPDDKAVDTASLPRITFGSPTSRVESRKEVKL